MPSAATPVEHAGPFTPEQQAAVRIGADEIEWRIGQTWKIERDGQTQWWGALLGYITARTCMDKLDALWPAWQSQYEPHLEVRVDQQGSETLHGYVTCRLTLADVTREDVGTPSTMEGAKGAFSDALKRAAVQFGIGRELYDLPKVAVRCEEKNGKAGKPLAFPTRQADGTWTIDSNFGYLRSGPQLGSAGGGSSAPRQQQAVDPALGLCPIHKQAFRMGNYGAYCPTKVGEGEGGKAVWCDQKPGQPPAPTEAAPAPPPPPAGQPAYVEEATYSGAELDVDDLPF